ncbi:YesL family protein [Microbacterium suwonense]|uniref:DUF624 domain-containing protein n=1 Tax=Microbacterium suwonense TaxID=683047 RepID=A0ABM8FV03_9MICO|nr:DUF624 domain-containing protein [Microbacterium suwonense]BDZ39505.1 hypothetical protein GCM10025863_21190 [Microbacterium suwonense]
MASIFAADSALMRTLTRIADIMILNILFIVTSLPLFTLGASLTALNFTAMRIATGTDQTITGDYLRSFRSNFRQGTAIWGLLFGASAVFAAWHIVVSELVTVVILQLALFAVWYVLVFLALVTVLWLFPYLAKFEGTIRETIRNARLLSWRHPFTTLLALVVIALCAVITVFYPQATGYGLLWLLIGFAGIAVVNGALLAHVFNRYIDTPEES